MVFDAVLLSELLAMGALTEHMIYLRVIAGTAKTRNFDRVAFFFFCLFKLRKNFNSENKLISRSTKKKKIQKSKREPENVNENDGKEKEK